MPDGSRGEVLVAIAREAIEVIGPFPAMSSEEWLNLPGASFVTLKLDDDLRGCIGSLEARKPLGEDVAHNARAAAYRDPRFPPVSSHERPRLQIEVSVLSTREPIDVASESDLLSQLRPGVDGIYLEYGGMSSTFLPQVWESLPDPAQFMAHLKQKAGLPADFWNANLRLSRYTVQKYL